MNSLLEFFKQELEIKRIYGIPVRIDYRWFVVFAVLTVLSASSIPSSVVEDEFGKLALGAASIFLFFVSIFFHELAHANVARREGIDVLDILLHPFGGLARLRREPDTPQAEFRIAIAGPVVSFIIALFFLGLWSVSDLLDSNILTVSFLAPLFFILFLLNLLLAIFNLFPGYPLDGGRVLRAYLWRKGTDLNKATILTGQFGQIIAVTLVVFGIAIMLISRQYFTGVWMILVGIFLFDSALGIIKETNSFESLTVENIMELPTSVKPDTTIQQFIDHVLPLYRKTRFPVAENKQLFGFILLKDIKENLPKSKWNETKIKDAMRPIREDYFIDIDASVVEAKELLRTNGVGALGVLNSKGKFVGYIRRGKIKRRV